MGAADASLSEALDLLRGQWHGVADGIMKGEYALWVGSGISREKFPDVPKLLKMLLDHLQCHASPADPNCPYIQTLREILGLTTVCQSDVDFSRPPDEWRGLNDLVGQLCRQYSRVLDHAVRLDGEVKDLCWDILELPKIYGDSTVLPDAEHTFLALLVEEGLLHDVVTTNWDPLIEVAHEQCRAGRRLGIHVVACNDEFDASGSLGRTRLLKIHGCARKALLHADRYRPFMVATHHQITVWNSDASRQPFQDALRTLLRQKPALFVGLSGQDWNVQGQFFLSFLARDSLPTDPPRVTFCKERIEFDQQAILKNVYGEDAYNSNAREIDRQAALPLYGKPLLGALYLLTVFEKAARLLELGSSELSTVHKGFVTRMLSQVEGFLRSRYDAAADPADCSMRWRLLAEEVPPVISHFVSIYREQVAPRSAKAYSALYDRDLAAMAADPNIPLLKLPWLLLVIAAFWEGTRRGWWKLHTTLGTTSQEGQLEVECSGSTTKLFVIDSAEDGLARLFQNGFLDADSHAAVLIVYPRSSEPVRRPGPPGRRLPGCMSPDRPHQVWFREVADSTPTIDELTDRLRNEVIAV